MNEDRLPSKFAFILHADVAGSTELVRQDEHTAHQRIQDTFRRFGETIKNYHGNVRELRGDALLAEFERASDAVAAALAFQANQTDYNTQLDDHLVPMVRVGIAMGEVVIADNTITGDGVVLAQRLEQLAEPGGVCVHDAAYQSIPKRLPFEYRDLGEQRLKGFDEVVRAYSVHLPEGTEPPEPSELPKVRLPPVVRWALTAAVIVLIGAGGLLAWYQPWAPDFEPVSPDAMAFPLPDKPSIAVLPFINLSGDPKQDYLSDGLTENILTELSRFRELFVIARNSTMVYKDNPVKIQQVAKELGVRYVLEGSIQTDDDRVRVTAQLNDAISGAHIWAERYDRDLQDIFKVQDEITRAIVASLHVNIEQAEFDRVRNKPIENLKAYELEHQAHEKLYTFTKEGVREALPLFKEVVEMDPTNMKAHLGLALCYLFNYRWGWGDLSREESLELALDYANKAAALAPYDHHPHWLIGKINKHAGNFEKAAVLYDKAMDMNPNDSEMLAESSDFLIDLGRAEEALERIQTAMRLNPRHPDWPVLEPRGCSILLRAMRGSA